MQSETKNCQNCKNDFVIEPDDFGFYEKIQVPPPTFCSDCRRQRRWAWRNNMSLYNRKCDMCGKGVVSIYSPSSGLTIYCNKCWWSDKWDSKSYAVDYDFTKPFFNQFRELIQRVPHMSVVNDDGIASLNCEYTHDWWFSKNCYMAFTGWRAENIMYSYYILAGKNMVDCINIRSENEWLYECNICAQCYNCKYSQFSKGCIDSNFVYNCINCSNCFMCYSLVGKKYCFKNKQYTKEGYEKILESYKLDTYQGVEKAKDEFREFMKSQPRRYAQNFHIVSCIGDIISYSKNLKYCFNVKKSENSSYCDFSNGEKDTFDVTTTGEVSECYECVVGDHSQKNLFGLFSVKSQDIKYCQHCHNIKYSFGCVGLRNDKYCILNKQYTKEEYEDLLPKIISHMNEMPYIDKLGIVYKYGEFYPIELSTFGYNESFAPELNLYSKQDASDRGYQWEDNLQRTTGKETLLPDSIPESIKNVFDTILDDILICLECKRNYKIIPNELIFYKRMNIPIPRKCFMCRHESRVRDRNPLKLWHRECMCKESTHFHEEGKCPNEFKTSFAPERPEIVYCEKCYQAEVY
jgi:hypothetical protein